MPRRKQVVIQKKKSYKKTVWLFAGAFVFIQVFFTLQTISFGSKLSELEKRNGELAEHFADLNEDYAEVSSLTKVKNLADDLDFSSPKKTYYIKSVSNLTHQLR
jgi:hypothetical protein